MHFQAPLAANSATQQPFPQPIDLHHHALGGLLHMGHSMSFQTQLFSDKGFNEHLGSGPFVFFGRNNEINPMPGCRSNPSQSETPSSQRASTAITLFGEEPVFVSIPGFGLYQFGLVMQDDFGEFVEAV